MVDNEYDRFLFSEFPVSVPPRNGAPVGGVCHYPTAVCLPVQIYSRNRQTQVSYTRSTFKIRITILHVHVLQMKNRMSLLSKAGAKTALFFLIPCYRIIPIKRPGHLEN
jgi:hypothetical protein